MKDIDFCSVMPPPSNARPPSSKPRWAVHDDRILAPSAELPLPSSAPTCKSKQKGQDVPKNLLKHRKKQKKIVGENYKRQRKNLSLAVRAPSSCPHRKRKASRWARNWWTVGTNWDASGETDLWVGFGWGSGLWVAGWRRKSKSLSSYRCFFFLLRFWFQESPFLSIVARFLEGEKDPKRESDWETLRRRNPDGDPTIHRIITTSHRHCHAETAERERERTLMITVRAGREGPERERGISQIPADTNRYIGKPRLWCQRLSLAADHLRDRCQGEVIIRFSTLTKFRKDGLVFEHLREVPLLWRIFSADGETWTVFGSVFESIVLNMNTIIRLRFDRWKFNVLGVSICRVNKSLIVSILFE